MYGAGSGGVCRMLMRWIVVCSMFVFAVPTAEAYSYCEVSDVSGFDQRTVPKGCPLSFYRGETAYLVPTKIYRLRQGERLDVTASVTIEMSVVQSTDIHLDCDGVEDTRLVDDLPIYIHRFELTDDIEPYDDLESDGGGGRIFVDPPGPCDIDAIPAFVCHNTPPWCTEDPPPPAEPTVEETGCSTTNGSTWLVGLLALGLIPRRRLR